MSKYTVQVAGKHMSAARQTGQFEYHQAGCTCRRCRRMRKAQERRVTTRYGQGRQS